MPSYHGYNIILPTEDKPYYFSVDFQGEGGMPITTYDTYSKARDAIDKHRQAMVKQRKLNLPVVNDQGEMRTITGVSLHDGRVTGIGKEANACYPEVDWIAQRVQDIRDLEEKAESMKEDAQQLRASLMPFRIIGSGYMGRDALDRYNDKLAAIEEDYKRKRIAALEGGPTDVKPSRAPGR